MKIVNYYYIPKSRPFAASDKATIISYGKKGYIRQKKDKSGTVWFIKPCQMKIVVLFEETGRIVTCDVTNSIQGYYRFNKEDESLYRKHLSQFVNDFDKGKVKMEISGTKVKIIHAKDRKE